MISNVIYPRFVDTQDLPADAVLERAKGELTTAIVVGFDHDGKPWLYSSWVCCSGHLFNDKNSSHDSQQFYGQARRLRVWNRVDP